MSESDEQSQVQLNKVMKPGKVRTSVSAPFELGLSGDAAAMNGL